MTGTATILRADARSLPLADASVDLIVTSPPYFALRSYTDGGEHYDGQIGAEATPAEYIAALVECTREWMRVLKPCGSIFVNLGDSYAGKPAGKQGKSGQRADRASANEPARAASRGGRSNLRAGALMREDAAWLAGVIDSDGSVSVHLNEQPEGRAPSFVPWVRIGQMRPEVVQRVGELTCVGQVYEDARGVWNWSASAQQARWVLERIHPWLLIKRRQALAAIEVARHVEERNARGSWRPLEVEDVAYRQRLRDAVLTWNAGGVDDLDPPEAAPVVLPRYPHGASEKSLMALPELYRISCIYELGLIARAVVVWSKPNGLPESVQDRVRRSHEDWVHLTKRPRYYSAVDAIREPHRYPLTAEGMASRLKGRKNSIIHNDNRGSARGDRPMADADVSNATGSNPLGKLPGSVWEIATEPLTVPDHLDVDHFAAFPTEWPRRIILGWSPSGICVECGEGRRPVVERGESSWQRRRADGDPVRYGLMGTAAPLQRSLSDPADRAAGGFGKPAELRLLGDACACPESTAPARPAVVLDPFGGTGTTALVAEALGRQAISVDMSADYCRLAAWRTTDPGQLAKAMRVSAPPKQSDGQVSLFDEFEVQA